MSQEEANQDTGAVVSAIATSDSPENDRSPPSKGLKRRQSKDGDLALEQGNKRARQGTNAETVVRENEDVRDADLAGSRATQGEAEESQPSTSRPERRKPKQVDEKGRSKRLFGALLGNLKQPSDRTTKKRQEIEARRKAEVQRQDEERAEDSQKRREELAERQEELRGVVEEERVRYRSLAAILQMRQGRMLTVSNQMRTRHQNMLERANFLYTKAEPRIYYRPWELRDEEEDIIDDQIRDAQALIDEELEDFAQRPRQRTDPSRRSSCTYEQTETPVAAAHGNVAMPPVRANGDADDPLKSPTDEHSKAKESVGPSDTPVESIAVKEDQVSAKSDTDETDRVQRKKPPSESTPESDPTATDLASAATAKTADTNANSEPAEVEVGDDRHEKAKDEAAKQEEDGGAIEDDEDHVVEGDEDTVIY